MWPDYTLHMPWSTLQPVLMTSSVLGSHKLGLQGVWAQKCNVTCNLVNRKMISAPHIKMESGAQPGRKQIQPPEMLSSSPPNGTTSKHTHKHCRKNISLIY